MKSLTRRQFVRLCEGAAASIVSSGCAGVDGRRENEVQATLFCFDTVCTLGGVMGQRTLEEAEGLCMRFERLLSRTIATSDVSRVNGARGQAVEVDPQTAELVRLAMRYCEKSNGLFDVTIGAVSELWDFKAGVVPSDDAIRAALPHVGWEQVDVGKATIRLADPEARLDLGGIAKGYIADRLVDLFAERGVASGFVNLGGNVKVLGPKADGSPWTVGVQNPFDEDGPVVAKIRTVGGSLVTSGLYERAFEAGGRRYWHILDPRTGYPVESSLVSASIYSAASVDGDGFTKPLFMLGQSEAISFVESQGGLQALLVDQNGAVSCTSNSEFDGWRS